MSTLAAVASCLPIVVADIGDNAVSVLLGNGDGTFQVRVRCDYATVTGTRLVATDINGDQIPDLVGTSPGNTVAVMLGRGDGTLQPQVQFAGGRSPTSVAVADFNSDGRPDFIVSSNQLILLMATCLP